MRPGLHEPVSVVCGYAARDKTFSPLSLRFGGREYRLGPVDFYHKTKQGTTVLHHFSVASNDAAVYFKIVFSATTLNWTLEEYMFGGDGGVVYAKP